MSIEVGIERIDGLDEVRARLGNTGEVNRHMTRILNEAARIGAQSARMYAPKRSGALANSIHEDLIQFSVADSHIEASFGVERVLPREVGTGRFRSGSRDYPIFVHEGTGVFGRLHRIITPRRSKYMVFVGKTGLVRRTSVLGQRPQPFMREAYEDVQSYIEAHLGDMIRGLIE